MEVKNDINQKQPAVARVLFTERQFFRQWWLIITMIIVNAPIIFGFVMQVVFGMPFGNSPMSNAGLTFLMLLLAGFTITFFMIELKTIVTHQGVEIHFFPFFKSKKFAFEHIEEAAIREYKPLFEYGGWGLRGNFKGMAYTVSGNQGLQLSLNTKKKILIGTRKPDELAKAITAASLPKN